MTAIQRLIVSKPGGFERLELTTATPKPLAAGEVRMRVRASGVNYADAMVRRGLYRTAKKYVGYPIAPTSRSPATSPRSAPTAASRSAIGSSRDDALRRLHRAS